MSELSSQKVGELSPQKQLFWFHNYFRPHFDEWVTGTIGKYISVPEALVAFILITLAIDWLAGFWYGEPTDYRTKEAYTGFVGTYFSKDYDPEKLYQSLRNGLTHLFAIKDSKYLLIHNQSWRHFQVVGDRQILNSEDFYADWLRAKNSYFVEVARSPMLLKKLVQRYDRDGFLDAIRIP